MNRKKGIQKRKVEGEKKEEKEGEKESGPV
jgi:hypothetical protein